MIRRDLFGNESFYGWGQSKPFKLGGKTMKGYVVLPPNEDVKEGRLVGSPLLMKMGGLPQYELYSDVRNIGFSGGKTYLPTI